jgi:ubiquinone/menaquinone biosynthesis C-methylase UbiE
MWWRDREGVEPAVIAEVADLRGKRILEVGCGRGRLTEFAAATAEELYAFDPDAAVIEEARERLDSAVRSRVTFAVASAETFDLPRRRFDIALCGWSL